MEEELEEAFKKSYHDQAIFIEAIFNESERACVIVGAAKIDEMLERIMKKILLPSANNRDEIFASDKPLSSFSAKIDLAYRLGIIDSQFQRELHLLRKIRNAFSHDVLTCSLADEPHVNRLNELFESVSKDEKFNELLDKTSGKFKASDEVMKMKLVAVHLSGLLSAIEYWSKPIHDINSKYISNNR